MSGWAAGANYSLMLARSLKAANADAVYLTESQVPAPVPTVTVPPLCSWPGEGFIRQALGLPPRSALPVAARAAQVDVVLPVTGPIGPEARPARIGWIPDFQHRHLPQFYSTEQRRTLDERFTKLSAECRLMLMSSEAARKDFEEAVPAFREKARVCPFPSLFAFEPPAGSAGAARAKYVLPERFALVVNQFWQHKNHRVVAEALGLLNKQGLQIFTVMIGQPSDYRDRQNRTLSALLQECATQGVWKNCLILGQVPREDLVDLLRCATFLVQPSLFEGWNTSVQDAKALGCPVVASDLAVHREQLGEAGSFFPAEDATQLAARLAEAWTAHSTRPREDLERAALAGERDFAAAHGRRLLEICREAV
jgi:glycosyltransferase involved in cell wall biosynthesis